ncbi:hypothetical protein DFP72DRAFT_843222 [Ephemerocybe angulata]|uniref:Uncharacterized protein n=1 Tax=Ephemerocybe angulata TaxID=980116 RepID=A0A8H6IAM2_9AGAR|nr:hypothetical protein DFP72DRAFT_843222 [Tulosesus angulatus]
MKKFTFTPLLALLALSSIFHLSSAALSTPLWNFKNVVPRCITVYGLAIGMHFENYLSDFYADVPSLVYSNAVRYKEIEVPGGCEKFKENASGAVQRRVFGKWFLLWTNPNEPIDVQAPSPEVCLRFLKPPPINSWAKLFPSLTEGELEDVVQMAAREPPIGSREIAKLVNLISWSTSLKW